MLRTGPLMDGDVGKCSYSVWAGAVGGALGVSSAGPSTCKSALWLVSPTGPPWFCDLSALSEGVRVAEGATLGVSLRSTRGPTSGWVSMAASELGCTAAPALGAAWVGLEAVAVSAVLSLAGLLCAVLKLSATELVAVEGSKFTTGEAESAPAGLFCREGEAGRK